jgi:hypothetical protein
MMTISGLRKLGIRRTFIHYQYKTAYLTKSRRDGITIEQLVTRVDQNSEGVTLFLTKRVNKLIKT